MKIIDRIKGITYEEGLIFTTVVAAAVGALFAVGKIILGIVFDPVLIAAGMFSAMLVVAKLTCIIGAKKNRGFRRRNTFTSVFLFLGGLLYCVYMSISLYYEVAPKDYDIIMAVGAATLAFGELGLAIYGIAKTKRRAHDFRNIQIINFASALISVMTAQIALLAFQKVTEAGNFNAYSGIGVGVITMLMAVYVYFAPQFSTIGREHNTFTLTAHEKNSLISQKTETGELTLCKSSVYPSYVYRYTFDGTTVDGNIERTKGFWHKLPLLLKILFIILSEILIFVYAFGYAIYFVRSVDMPAKLKKVMEKNGFALKRNDIVCSANSEIYPSGK